MSALAAEIPALGVGRLALLGTGTVGSAFVQRYQALRARGGKASADGSKARIVVPWFAFGFVAVAGFNSLHLLPAGLQAGLVQQQQALKAEIDSTLQRYRELKGLVPADAPAG